MRLQRRPLDGLRRRRRRWQNMHPFSRRHANSDAILETLLGPLACLARAQARVIYLMRIYQHRDQFEEELYHSLDDHNLSSMIS